MKEKIEVKIDEVIEYIISKDVKDVTYNEYRILDNRLSQIKWDSEQKERNKEMAELMSKTFSMGFGNIAPTPLPDLKED